ncbi:MAG: phage tail protein [Desulfatiglandaceae bacterium]
MKREEIKSLLPQVFQRTLRSGSPLNALLEVMELLHAPAEEVLGQLEIYFNAYSAPDIFVPYLACWVDLDRFYPFYSDQPEDLQRSVDPISSGTGQLRELIAAAAYLSQWRGTAKGLKLFLETATGINGFDLVENVDSKKGEPRPFHILITAPAEAEKHIVLIERIVEQEKPAYVSYELEFKL